MANYNNANGFAQAFNTLSGILGQFLGEEIVKDREARNNIYDDQKAERNLQNTIVGNAIRLAQTGQNDLYEQGLGNAENVRTLTSPVKVAGRTVTTVATPQTIETKIDKIDYPSVITGLRSGNIRSKVNANEIKSTGNNNMVVLEDGALLRQLNKVYPDANFKVGDAVPYSMFGKIESSLARQQKASDAGVITPKEAMSQLNKWVLNYSKINMPSADELVVAMVEDPVSNGYLQQSGQYNEAIQRYKAIKEKNKNNVPEESQGWFQKLFGNSKKTSNYKIMQDANGNKAKVYDDGTIEEL